MSKELSRRQFIRVLGAGTLLASGVLTPEALAQDPTLTPQSVADSAPSIPESKEQQINQEHFRVPFYTAQSNELADILSLEGDNAKNNLVIAETNLLRLENGQLVANVGFAKEGGESGTALWAETQSLANTADTLANYQIVPGDQEPLSPQDMFTLQFIYKKNDDGTITDQKIAAQLIAQADFDITGQFARSYQAGDAVYFNLETGTQHYINRSEYVSNTRITVLNLDADLIQEIATSEREAYGSAVDFDTLQPGDVIPAELDENNKIVQIITQDRAVFLTRQQLDGSSSDVNVRSEPSTAGGQNTVVGKVNNQFLAKPEDLVNYQLPAGTPEPTINPEGGIIVQNDGLTWLALKTPEGQINWVSESHVENSGVGTKTVAVGPKVKEENLFKVVRPAFVFGEYEYKAGDENLWKFEPSEYVDGEWQVSFDGKEIISDNQRSFKLGITNRADSEQVLNGHTKYDMQAILVGIKPYQNTFEDIFDPNRTYQESGQTFTVVLPSQNGTPIVAELLAPNQMAFTENGRQTEIPNTYYNDKISLLREGQSGSQQSKLTPVQEVVDIVKKDKLAQNDAVLNFELLIPYTEQGLLSALKTNRGKCANDDRCRFALSFYPHQHNNSDQLYELWQTAQEPSHIEIQNFVRISFKDN